MTKEVVLLLAEDDPGHAILIKKYFEKSRILNTIRHFKDGQECYEFLFQKDKDSKRQQATPYILFLDIRMPRMDGIDLLRHIKKDKNLSKMPVIMITSTEDPETIKLCYKLGCNNYITKPIDYNKFDEVIRHLEHHLALEALPTKIKGK